MPDPWQTLASQKSLRFDLVTLLVGVTIWAGVLSIMRWLNFPTVAYVAYSVVLVVVGIGLARFRRLYRPFTVSVFTGIVVTWCMEFLFSILQDLQLPRMDDFQVAWYLLGGGVNGALAFFAFDAVLLLSDRVRSFLNR